MVEDALQIKARSVSYLSEATSWDETLYDLGAIACYKLGLFDKSFEFATKAVLLNPKNQRLKENMKMINQKAVENKGRQKNE
jgi:tetratricopeptide (TPR) repeat protein